jgi:pimeloyl-ACP methyl ester carboxylesterase
MAAAIEGASLVRVAGAGHLTPLERPDEVAGALVAFLEELGA